MSDFVYPVPYIGLAEPFIAGQHLGIDLICSVGTSVQASTAGTVTYEADEPSGYGNVIFLTRPDGWSTRYGHLSAFKVAQGDSVPQGAVIGLSGGAKGAPGAGDSTGPHLHFEIRDPSGTAINPTPILSGQAVPTAAKSSSSGSSGGTLDGIANFFGELVDPKTWVRIGEILGGIIVMYIAYKIVRNEGVF